VYPSKDFSAVLKKAQADQKKRGDTYLGALRRATLFPCFALL
jgi:hypothetical protein